MSSALALLRAAIGRGDVITVDSDSIVLGDGTRLNRKKPTNFKSMRGRGTPYLLETVYFQFKHHLLPYNDYVKKCNQEKVSHVTPLDKKDLVAYLKGEINDCAGLVAPEPEDPSDGVTGPDGGALRMEAAASLPPSGRKRGFAEMEEVPAPVRDEPALAGRPRSQRCLDAVMCVNDWDFTPLREKLGAAVAKLRANGGRSQNASSASAEQQPEKRAYDPRGDRYTATDDRFYRENMGSDFYSMGIDPSASFKTPSKVASHANGARGRGSESANVDKGSSVSVAKKPETSSRENPSRFSSASAPRSSSHRPSYSEPPAKHSQLSAKDMTPIIIVPANTSSSSMLTIGNLPRFLESGEYVTVKELRSRGEGPSGIVSRLRVRRKPGGSAPSADYELVSNPNKLMPSEWDRVVAVVCTGQQWQFKKWPGWKADSPDNGISEIFRSMCGFFFHVSDTEPPALTKNWAVTFLPLERHRRHNDIKVQSRFWDAVDAHIRLRKKNIRY